MFFKIEAHIKMDICNTVSFEFLYGSQGRQLITIHYNMSDSEDNFVTKTMIPIESCASISKHDTNTCMSGIVSIYKVRHQVGYIIMMSIVKQETDRPNIVIIQFAIDILEYKNTENYDHANSYCLSIFKSKSKAITRIRCNQNQKPRNKVFFFMNCIIKCTLCGHLA